jgi:hypothetical protein
MQDQTTKATTSLEITPKLLRLLEAQKALHQSQVGR